MDALKPGLHWTFPRIRRLSLSRVWVWTFFSVALCGAYAGLFPLLGWTDESFALAVPYRFFLGDRPFHDELNVAQLYALLTYPLVHLFLEVQGSTDGIVLYFRHLWFLAHVALFLLVRHVLKEQWGETRATMAALVVLAFDPFSRRTLDYKTLYWGFFTAALVLDYGARRGRKAGWRLAAGSLLSLSCFVNPGGIPVALAYLGLRARSDSRSGFRLLLGAGAAGLALAILVGVFLDLEALGRIQTYHEGRGSTFSKMWERLGAVTGGTLSRNWEKKLAILFLVVGSGFLARRYSSSFRFMFLVAPLMWAVSFEKSGMVLYLGAVGGALYFLLRGDGKAWELVKGLWIPSVFSGLCTGVLSDSGLPNASISLLPALLVTLLLLMRLTDGDREGEPSTLAVLGPGLAVVLLLFSGAEFRLERQATLRPFPAGPFAGIRERSWVREPLDELVEVLNRQPRGEVLFYGGWASFGYLLSSHRPLAPTVYRCASGDRPCFRYFRERHGPNTLVVQWKGPPRPAPAFWRIRYNPGDGLDGLLRRHYRILHVSPHYWIWKRREDGEVTRSGSANNEGAIPPRNGGDPATHQPAF